MKINIGSGDNSSGITLKTLTFQRSKSKQIEKCQAKNLLHSKGNI